VAVVPAWPALPFTINGLAPATPAHLRPGLFVARRLGKETVLAKAFAIDAFLAARDAPFVTEGAMLLMTVIVVMDIAIRH